ncbi:MAG TPA: circadian clock protein KaiC [Xanthobacteraceae bacterium]|nr:circadian clock protein KaiC [Xanthobacteraceae bacterium]
MGRAAAGIQKAKTGIIGLDDLTGGGFPAGRPTLVCGAAGCGKTLLALTFLYNGAARFDEPGVFMTFEERPQDLIDNVASLNYDLGGLIKEGKIAIDHVRVERSEIEETGEYDLEGLFIRLGYAIDRIGAKRVVLDTIEALFGGLSNEGVLRAELRRLFEWLKSKGVTAIITGERGEGALTRHGLEEYVSDCVILLDNRVHEHVTTRRLRVVKYRGSAHGTNEYPFLIDEAGISVMPVTSAGLDHMAPDQRISSGIADLDEMLEGRGYFRGSSVLVSGMAGSGKSSVAAQFADSVCRGGERCIYFALEESPAQIIRNMSSIGLDLQRWVDEGRLRFAAHRPSLYGLETHLATMHRDIEELEPTAVVIDPLSSLLHAGDKHDAQAMILRLVDFLKSRGITTIFTSLTHGNVERAMTDMQVSSLMDAWLLLYNRESNGEHNRQLYLIKARGMAHSNQVREFIMTDKGILLREAYVGPGGVLTGSARVAQEAREREQAQQIEHEAERRNLDFARRRRRIEAQIEELQAQLAEEQQELAGLRSEVATRKQQAADDRVLMGESRKVAPRPK